MHIKSLVDSKWIACECSFNPVLRARVNAAMDASVCDLFSTRAMSTE